MKAVYRGGRPGRVENAFAALGDPEQHAKILIDPQSKTTQPEAVK